MLLSASEAEKIPAARVSKVLKRSDVWTGALRERGERTSVKDHPPCLEKARNTHGNVQNAVLMTRVLTERHFVETNWHYCQHNMVIWSELINPESSKRERVHVGI